MIRRYLMILLTLLILLFSFGCQEKGSDKEVEVDFPEPTPSPEPTDDQTSDIDQDEETIKQEVLEEADDEELLSGLKCKNMKIYGYVTNIDDEKKKLGDDVKIIINGIVAKDIDCEKLVLDPGESTYCSNLAGHISELLPNVISTREKYEDQLQIIFNFEKKKLVEYANYCNGDA